MNMVSEHGKPLVWAHRGACDVAPENTLAAFDAAVVAGADGIELDVTRCATGEVVILHDDTLDRTTNGSGRVEALSFDALRRLDAGSWFAPQFAGERIPTLDEALELAGQRLLVNIEIKSVRPLASTGIEELVAASVRARGLQERVIISSFNPAILRRMCRLAPELARALLYAPDLPIVLARAWLRPWVQPRALHPLFSMVDADYMAWARRKGYRVNVWTVNEESDMAALIGLGVDGIITNHPRRLRELLDRLAADGGTGRGGAEEEP